jgi:urate oxidase
MLTDTAYGKARIRLVKLSRHGDRHDLFDWTIAVRFEGHYDESYTDGDNSSVLPTDTMKNTVYAMAAREPVLEPEPFGSALCHHFLERNRRLERVRVDVSHHAWGRVNVGAREHGQAFVRQGSEMRSAEVVADRQGVTISAGVKDLVILKSSRSAFAGFPRDEYTTLPETRDRILATSLTATWRYRDADQDFGSSHRAIRRTLLEAFAEHDSQSVQHTLHAMGQSVLASADHVAAIRLVMPNKHHLPVDVSGFGLENRNEIFIATDEPFGLIEATLVR